MTSARFTSRCLGDFFKRLERVDPHPAVLDLGVLCGDNITFLGNQGCRVSVESLPKPAMSALERAYGDWDENGRHRERDSQVPADVPTIPLKYPRESFSGVLAWDAIAQLPYEEGIGFVETLRQLLLEGGVVLAYFPGPPDHPRGASGRYRILDENNLSVEPYANRPPCGHIYQNRQIYAIFSRFNVVRLSHLKTGTREVLVVNSVRARRRMPHRTDLR